MKKIILPLWVFITSLFITCEKENTSSGTFRDSRDDHDYKWIKIGDQVWMAENLAFLPYVYSASNYSRTSPRFYVYDYQGVSVSEAKFTYSYSAYGVLYNWPATMNDFSSSSAIPSGVQGICPSGWHLPSDNEWKQLEIYLGMSQDDVDEEDWRGTDEGSKLKEMGRDHWASPNQGADNSSGFTALPGGLRVGSNDFSDSGLQGYWWSATVNEINDDLGHYPWVRSLGSDHEDVNRYTFYESFGLSVRCVRD
jgi:uncharacterized protein (TIGR02145 family)